MADPLWINASASGTPSYTATELRQAMALGLLYDGNSLGAREGVRPGGTQLNVTYANPTLSVAPGVAVVFEGSPTTRGPYWVALPAIEQHTVTAAHATNPRKDIVILRVYDHDEDSSGLRTALSEYIAGTPAASPVEPSVPAGAVKLATVDVPSSAGGGLGSAAVTMNFPYTVANGGILPLRTSAEESALSPYPGQVAYRLDTSLFRVRGASAWRDLGEVIVCTQATRPAHAAGRAIYETDTNRLYVSNGSAWKLVNYGVDGGSADVTTDQSTATTSYTDLATVGPQFTLYLEAGQKSRWTIAAELQISTAGATGAAASLDIAGPSSSDLAAADSNNIESGVVTEWVPGFREIWFTATSTGSHVGTMKYKAIGSATANFKNRRITAEPR